ncbi:two-component system, chemotaxis family, chemotaxis protein CheV [Candidatus Magnetomoraceae bacterium gMMP-15]
MSEQERQEILLESGTNEVEVAEFQLGKQSFGVNVAKIREFVPYDKKSVTGVPNSPKSMIGVFLLRGRTIPLIDLNIHLERDEKNISERPVVLVTEFNNMVNGFIIDAINQIHRLSWNDIKPLNPVLGKYTPRITGSVNVKESEILVLDLEHIISEIFPKKMKEMIAFKETISPDEVKLAKRLSKYIIIAEDSTMIRRLMKNTLDTAGYKNISAFDNGKDAYEYIVSLHKKAKDERKNISEYLNVIISDIEMPQMDGLTLCRKIREELKLKAMPIIMFSSLINDQMARKCNTVGANAYVTKPQMGSLVKLIDKYSI